MQTVSRYAYGPINRLEVSISWLRVQREPIGTPIILRRAPARTAQLGKLTGVVLMPRQVGGRLDETNHAHVEVVKNTRNVVVKKVDALNLGI